jgi:pimeloyl-ACP methyl ester carboxylesterase
MTTSQLLERPEGRIAYDVSGRADGRLVVCLPAMGELRSSYRHLVPLLVDRGYRVACLDLRGHGDSDTTFSSYDDEALASDTLALVEELGGPAYLVGNSMGAGAAVIAAAERPEDVLGLALVGPFVRNPPVGRLGTLVYRLMLTRPWGPAAFMAYYPKWTPGTRPEGYDEHTAAVRENLRRPGHWQAFVRTTRTSHAPAEARLADVTAPAVVVMGLDDVDWKDPGAEAKWLGEALKAEVVMAPCVGHYPQAQAPAVVADAVDRLARGARSDRSDRTPRGARSGGTGRRA